jgi:hypothetical protein
VDLSKAFKIEEFFEGLEVSGILDRGKDAIKELLEEHRAAAAAILGVKATVTIGHAAAPVYLMGVILVKHGIERYIDTLRQNVRDNEATRRVRAELLSNPYGIADLGGPAHVQFGEWIRQQEQKKSDGHQAFGGLTRWLDPATEQFAWLCPDDAYEQIASYRKSSRASTARTVPS